VARYPEYDCPELLTLKCVSSSESASTALPEASREEHTQSLLGRDFADNDILLEAPLAPGCGIVMTIGRHALFENKPLGIFVDTVLKLFVVEDH
jgi:hypothetical protein